jgi:zinc protease
MNQTILNRRQPPRIKDAVEFDLQLKACEVYTLDNGVQVWAINAGAEEVIQVEWVFYAGNSYELKDGIAAATSFLIKNGTSRKSAFEVNEAFDYYGAYLNRNCYNETANLVFHGLTKHLEALMPVVQELLTDARFPEEEMAIYQQNMKQRLAVNLKKCDVVANRLIDEYLYGKSHPYGKNHTAETYDGLDIQLIREFYNRYYRQGHLKMFIAGYLPSNLFEILNKYFGQLPFRAAPEEEPNHQRAPAAEKKQRVINDANGVQGAIRLARPFISRHHPDFKGAQVLNTLLGGFFGSRLMDNIREDKGYTYGIYSFLQNHLRDSAWVVSTEAGREVCEATIREVYLEMKKLREGTIPKDELMMVKNYLIGTILGDLDGPFQIIGRWKNLVLNGLNKSYFEDSVRTIKQISGKELSELANRYLVEEEFYELVVI